MEEFNFQQNLERLTRLSTLDSSQVISADIETLNECLILSGNYNSYFVGTHSDESLLLSLSKRALIRLVEENNFAGELLGDVLYLAERARLDIKPLITRMIVEKHWEQLADSIPRLDYAMLEFLMSCFINDPMRRFAEIIVSGIDFQTHFNLEKKSLLNQPVKVVMDKITTTCSEKQARQYAGVLLRDQSNPLEAIDLYDEILPFRTLEETLTALESAMKIVRQAQLNERAAINCSLKIISRSEDKRGVAKFIAELASLANTDFHAHRELTKGAQAIIEMLEKLLPKNEKLISSAIAIIAPSAVHQVAWRYILRDLSPNISSALLAILRRIDANLASEIDFTNGLDQASPIYDLPGSANEIYDPEARLWLKNYAVAARFFAPLEKSRTRFAERAKTEWERDEDALSESLCHLLFEELKSLETNPDVQKWISDKYKYGFIKISEPFVRNEEPVWGADIGLIVKMDVEDTLRHEWGYLFQAKKANCGVKNNPVSWDINRKQLEDLLFRTDSGFYLLYTPAGEKSSPLVLPARIVNSVLKAGDTARKRSSLSKAASLSYQTGQQFGKSWSSFLLEDVIGSWSGDWDQKLSEKIRNGTAARFVLEVSVALGRQAG